VVYLFQARFRWGELNGKGVSSSFEGGGGSLSNLIYCITGSRKTGRNRPSYCSLPPVLDQGNDCLIRRFKYIICVVQGISTSFFTCGNLKICELQKLWTLNWKPKQNVKLNLNVKTEYRICSSLKKNCPDGYDSMSVLWISSFTSKVRYNVFLNHLFFRTISINWTDPSFLS